MACYVMLVSSKDPRNRLHRGPGAWPTEWSVDMGEGRPASTPADPGRLSPLQLAWRAYTGHTASCPACRTIDGGRCDEASRLWQAHRDRCDEAYEQLAEAVSPPRQ